MCNRITDNIFHYFGTRIRSIEVFCIWCLRLYNIMGSDYAYKLPINAIITGAFPLQITKLSFLPSFTFYDFCFALSF